MSTPSVVVDTPQFRVVFCDCVADQFTAGVLTISRADDDREVEVYPPGYWTLATAIDGHGDALAHFRPIYSFSQRKSA